MVAGSASYHNNSGLDEVWITKRHHRFTSVVLQGLKFNNTVCLERQTTRALRNGVCGVTGPGSAVAQIQKCTKAWVSHSLLH